MKARVNNFLNIRTNVPEILPHNNSDNGFFSPGDVVEVADTLIGEPVNGNATWHMLDTGVFVTNEGLDLPRADVLQPRLARVSRR